MAKKMKLDTAQLKQFALEKGERVGLGVALAIMVVFVGYGLLKGLGARSPAGEIEKKTKQLAQSIDHSAPPTEERKDKVAVAPPPDWTPHFELFASAPDWFDPGAAGDSKRRNPEVLAVGDIVAGGEVKNLRREYLQGGVRLFAYNQSQQQLEKVKPAGTGAPMVASAAPVADSSYARELHPTRMVLVTATFPLRDQIEAIRKALRLNTPADLQAAQADPRFLGLGVYRREILPDGKTTEPIAIYDADDKGHPVAKLPETQLLLTTADYDEEATTPYETYLKPGLATPLPKFMVISGRADAEYPKLELAGIVAQEGNADPLKPRRSNVQPGGRPARGGRPGGAAPLPGGRRPPVQSLPGVPGPMGQPGQTDDRPTLQSAGSEKLSEVAKTNPKLASQLKGEFNMFDAEGGPLPEEQDPKALQAAGVVARFNAQLNQGRPGQNQDAAAPEKLLVRFFDADVQPGKTYQYAIKVRMANPNFGKEDEVAYPGLAAFKVLESEAVLTQPITIPQEYFVYVLDTPKKQLDESKAKGPKGTETDAVSTEKAAIQIHRWADKVKVEREEYVVADWIIAERLLIHRGEKLARPAVEVELPKWDKLRGTTGDFDLASSGSSSRGKAGARTRQVAAVDFYPPDLSKAEVLVDFVGGKHPYSDDLPGIGSSVHDDAATDLLVLRADGKLAVRSGREDADPDSPAGQERIHRYNAWRERISSLRPTDQSKMPGQPPP